MKKLFYRWLLSARLPCVCETQYFPEAAQYDIMDLHRAVHFIYVLSGKYFCRQNGEALTLAPGDFQFTAPWELHGGNRMEAGTRLLVLTAETDVLLGQMFSGSESLMSFFVLPVKRRLAFFNSPEARRAAEKLAERLTANGGNIREPGIPAMRCWHAVLEYFCDLLELLIHTEMPVCPSGNFHKLAPCLEQISLGKVLPQHSAAALCGLSPGYFSHLFRQTCYVPYSVYAMRNRLNFAALRLQDGCPVKQAAEEFGFCDISHFSRCFKRQFGMAPGHFH